MQMKDSAREFAQSALLTNPPRELGPLRKRGRANASLLGLR